VKRQNEEVEWLRRGEVEKRSGEVEEQNEEVETWEESKM
jgi:hypothetical protein